MLLKKAASTCFASCLFRASGFLGFRFSDRADGAGSGFRVDVTVRGAQFRCPDASHWLETSNSVCFAELEHWGLEVGRLEEEHEMARKSASKST